MLLHYNIGPSQAVLNLYHMSTLLWRCYNQWVSYSDLKVNLKLSLIKIAINVPVISLNV